jgi:hypothetical protein
MRNRRQTWLSLLLAAFVLLPVCAASAQLLPQSLPVQTPLHELPLPQVARDRLPLNDALAATRRLEVERLLRGHREVIDSDRSGAPVVRSEIVAIDPSDEALQRARAAGFVVAGEHHLDELGLRVVVLRARTGLGTRAALRRMQRLDPDGQYDYNHVYLGSASPAALPTAAAVSTASGDIGRIRVGLVDSGVDAAHPALSGVRVQAWGCGGTPRPDRHGTAVASLLAGDTGHGTPGATTLLAADIYCGQPTGGAATGLAEAMAWLARERAGVINLSLVGPHNRLLERVVQAMTTRGHVLVAAVGNDGPAAPPLYPAAYPQVIGVTAVDARMRALPEAARGPQVGKTPVLAGRIIWA